MATSDIKTIVQTYPDIGTDNSSYVDELIALVQYRIVSELGLSRWPESDAAGYSESAASPSTDLSSLSESSLLLKLDDHVEEQVTGIDVSVCTSGSATAAEVQRAVRAFIESGQSGYRSFSAVTVAYSTVYTITSPTIGDSSRVVVGADDDYFQVAAAMKLGKLYGGTEYPGCMRNEALEQACAQIVARAYRMYRMLPEVYMDSPSSAVARILEDDPQCLAILRGNKQWRF